MPSERPEATQVDRVVRLNAFVCTKLQPPKYAEAVENFDFLVAAQPGDLGAYLQRACCLMALQVRRYLALSHEGPLTDDRRCLVACRCNTDRLSPSCVPCLS